MKKFLQFVFRKNKVVTFNVSAETIPASLGYPLEDFDLLTNMLTNYLDSDNKVASFAAFIQSPLFKQFKLDLSDPNDSMVLGYAFCSAIILKRSVRSQETINKVLKAFNPSEPKNKTPN